MSIVSSTDVFDKIVGLKISYASFLDGVLTLVFGNCWTLGIYNSVTMTLDGKKLDTIDLEIIIEKSLTSTAETNLSFVMDLSNGASLVVDLSNEGFSGPEAMQLSGPDNLIMVWS